MRTNMRTICALICALIGALIGIFFYIIYSFILKKCIKKFNFDEKSLLFWNTQGVHQDNVYITLLSRDTGNISSNILLQKLTRSLRSLVRFSSRILDSIFSSIPRQEGNIDTMFYYDYYSHHSDHYIPIEGNSRGGEKTRGSTCVKVGLMLEFSWFSAKAGW